MNNKQVRYLQSWFSDYVSTFYSRGQNQEKDWAIQLKEKHSWRVREEIIAISQKLHASENEILLAEVLGLFHDIGRFYQYQNYKTFRDDISEDHAKIGVRIVENSHLLENLTEIEKNVLTKGILYHNTLTLPEEIDPYYLFFCKLLRDADKLDIWKVAINHYYKEQNRNHNLIIELGLPDTPGYSNAILNDLHSGQTASSNSISNLNDFKLFQIGWVYDINFYPTFQEIKKRNYIEKIATTLPKSQELNSVLKGVDKHLTLNLM